MKPLAVITLALLSTAALAEDWQPIPGSADALDRDSIKHRGGVVSAMIQEVGLPEAVEIAFDCTGRPPKWRVAGLPLSVQPWQLVGVGTKAENEYRVLCARSTKF